MPSCSDTPDPPRRRFQFSLRGLLIAQPALVLLVGVAFLVQCFGGVVINPLTESRWGNSVCPALINMGVPKSFVYEYVVLAFSFNHLGEWAILGLMNLVLGLLRSKRAHVGAWLLAIAFLFKDIVLWPQMAFFSFWVVSLCGSLIGLAAWFIGWRLRGRNYERAVELRPKELRNGLQIAIWILLAIAGSWGWSHLVARRSMFERLRKRHSAASACQAQPDLRRARRSETKRSLRQYLPPQSSSGWIIRPISRTLTTRH